MRLVSGFVAALLIAGATTRALAQPARPGVDTLVAKALVEQGVELARAGRCPAARRLFAEAVARDPLGPYAGRARALAAQCGGALAPPPAPPAGGLLDPYGDGATSPATQPAVPVRGPAAPPWVAAPPPPPVAVAGLRRDAAEAGVSYEEWRRTRERRAGRVQITIGLGLWGSFAGPAVAVLRDVRDPGASAALGLLAGPAVGVGAGLLLSSPADYTEGQALATVAGMWWGFWNGFGWPALRARSKGEEMLLGGLLASGGGIVVGALVGLTRPASGRVAMANSLGGYGAFTAAMLTVLAQPRSDSDYTRNALIGADAGVGLGILLGHVRPVSRGRMALLDGGAALGATVGFGASLLFMGRGVDNPSDTEVRFMAGVTLAGMAAGIITAWSLSGEWDRGPGPGRLSSVPALIGHDDAGWAFGAPAPRPLVSAAADGRRGLGAALDVVGGTF